MTNVPADNKIDASPTKEFFVYMLVKDIPLVRAIIDLVDNCLDGARRIREDGDYHGLWARIEAYPDRFRISDNCGGIPVDVARRYAFRFGRPAGAATTTRSIGQFGVGMKRALFKIGNAFNIGSATTASQFAVDVNVARWMADPLWEFTFSRLDEATTRPIGDTGTTISVTSLHPPVSEVFGLENFINTLGSEVASAHQHSVSCGLAITLNGIPLTCQPAELLQSSQIKPAYQQYTYTDMGESPVNVKIYAGVAESDPSAAGWYVYCNGRMVLEADQTITTGWWEGSGKTIPKYHNQFAMFRGYAFFDCDDAGLLPWNTTKTGVDADSGLFRSVRLQMITLMRPVIDFLNRLDAEKDDRGDTGEHPLEEAVKEAQPALLPQVVHESGFVAPEPPPQPPAPQTGKIIYSKPLDQIQMVKDAFNLHSNKEVGEFAFDYLVEQELTD